MVCGDGWESGKGVGLQEQHAVAVGVETVALLDGVGVGAKDGLAAEVGICAGCGEGGGEHEEGGFGEVEVGEQARDDTEAVAGGEKDGGRA